MDASAINNLFLIGALLVGTDPRNEAPVLNARIRKAWTQGANVALGSGLISWPVWRLQLGLPCADRPWARGPAA